MRATDRGRNLNKPFAPCREPCDTTYMSNSPTLPTNETNRRFLVVGSQVRTVYLQDDGSLVEFRVFRRDVQKLRHAAGRFTNVLTDRAEADALAEANRLAGR